jgi:hypothetical protein
MSSRARQVTGYLPTCHPAYDSLEGKDQPDRRGETIDWSSEPEHVACKLNGNRVFNVIDTICPRAGLTVATTTSDRVRHQPRSSKIRTTYYATTTSLRIRPRARQADRRASPRTPRTTGPTTKQLCAWPPRRCRLRGGDVEMYFTCDRRGEVQGLRKDHPRAPRSVTSRQREQNT